MAQDVVPNSYWQALKDRMGELNPMNLIRNQMGEISQGAVMNPNARPSTPTEAMPAGIDPVARQALIQAIMQRQAGGPPQGMPPTPAAPAPADVGQRMMQEFQQREAQRGGEVTQENPAGIQF